MGKEEGEKQFSKVIVGQNTESITVIIKKR